MKITDPDIIKSGEEDLIEAVKSDLDLDAVKEILKDRLKAAPLSPRGGEIVVHDNKIAFRLDFDIILSGSLLFDRDGNYIAEHDQASPALEDPLEAPLPPVAEETPKMDSEELDSMDLDLMDSDTLNESDALNELEELDDAPQELDAEDESLDLDDKIIELEDIDNDDSRAPEDALKDDINDIIRESREFWEQKKG